MTDDVIGSCLGVAFLACYDVCLGVCYDFLSIRHSCTQSLCSCRRQSLEIDPGEREQLIHSVEPTARRPMQKPLTE